uniref:HSF_DOMAIN domain-containing protein n=1 Tax=Macrostomum lignano TaxID=282301 RepID=A0A1I8F6U7_9PLAT
ASTAAATADKINKRHQCLSKSSTRPARRLPGFLVKLWTLVNDPTIDSIISWDSTGDCILISDGNALAAEHNNLASFTRQLNMYGFHKLASADSSGQMHFQHPYFRQGQPELLPSVNRQMLGGGGRYSLALTTRHGGTAATTGDAMDPQQQPSVGTAPCEGTSDGVDDRVSLNGRDAVQAALTEMRTRQSATDQQLRRLCDENHKLWLELDNLRGAAPAAAAAMVNRSANQGVSGGGGIRGPRISEPDLQSAADSSAAAAAAASSMGPLGAATSSGSVPSGTSGFNRKRPYPFSYPQQQQLMAIEMPLRHTAIEAPRQRRAITQLPPMPTTPQPPPPLTPTAVSTSAESPASPTSARKHSAQISIPDKPTWTALLLAELVQSPPTPQQPPGFCASGGDRFNQTATA